MNRQSRLGVKNYWPSQHRWLWDNAMSEYDSLTINQRQPWYSLEYQDIIQKDSLDVYGSTHTGIWKSVGITGQKQYEITDHLGNVLSTVSDGRGSNAPHTSTDSFTITGYEPAIKSITDYYPFGMQMPDRCYSDGTTHTTNISAVTTVPVHHMVNRVWPDFAATSIGGAVILTGSSPLGLVASGAETLSYELPRYIGGLLHTVRIFTHGTVPPGFRAEISMGGTSSSTTAFSGISTDLTYTPTSISVPYLHIYNLGMRDTIFIDSVHIDSATYEPYHVLSSISSSDGYAYGFNGQMKVNEWAGSGNHLDFGARGYDPRVARFISPDAHKSKYPYLSPYVFAGNSPIIYVDYDGNDFGVIMNSNKKTIVIVANIYTTSKTTYDQALAAAGKWNEKTAIVSGYSVSFKINAQPPSKGFFNANQLIERSARDNAAWNDAISDAIGNVFSGTDGFNSSNKSGEKFVAGVTQNGKHISMHYHDELEDMGQYVDLVVHEIGHLLGLDDLDGDNDGKVDEYYGGDDGIMEYKGTSLSPISDKDVHTILRFAKDALNGKTKETDPKVTKQESDMNKVISTKKE